MPAKKKFDVIEGAGRSHLTKAEKVKRSAQEPKPEAVKRLRAPVYLPEHLREDFNDLTQQLIKAKTGLCRLDADAVARYLMSRDSWAAAHFKARDALDTDDPADSAAWARVAKTYFDQCQALANTMGLTLNSRCKLVVPGAAEEPQEDAMARMLRERSERRKA